MAKSVNNVTLLGRLGQDPEIRSTPGGSSVCTLNIATNESYKDKNGEWQETTDWHRVVLWDRLADVAAQYLTKGRQVYIEGKLKTRTYEKDGSTRYMTEVLGRNLILLDGRGEGGGSPSGSSYSKPSQPSQAMPASPMSEEPDDDDEVPF